MSIQDDQKKFSEDEFKVYKKKMGDEAEAKGEMILWGERVDPNHKPDRRIFKIDVGNLPIGKAEEYIKSIKEKYRK